MNTIPETPIVILMEDDLIHSVAHLVCGDPTDPCQQDARDTPWPGKHGQPSRRLSSAVSKGVAPDE